MISTIFRVRFLTITFPETCLQLFLAFIDLCLNHFDSLSFLFLQFVGNLFGQIFSFQSLAVVVSLGAADASSHCLFLLCCGRDCFEALVAVMGRADSFVARRGVVIDVAGWYVS